MTAYVDDTVLEVSKILRDTQQRHLVVIDRKDQPVGFLSVVDINNRVIAEEKNPQEVDAQTIMTKDIVTIDEHLGLEEALELMMKKNVLSCPVLRNKKLIGICEIKDVAYQLQKQKGDGPQ